MTKKVQRAPRELLGLLGMVGESPPNQLLDEYRGTIEMVDLAIAQLPLEEEFTITAAAVAGSTAVVTVPANQVWFVTGAQSSVTFVTTGNELNMSLRWSGGFLAEKFWRGAVSCVSTGANGTYTFGANIQQNAPLIAHAGNTFTTRVDQIGGAGNKDITTFVNFRRVAV